MLECRRENTLQSPASAKGNFFPSAEGKYREVAREDIILRRSITSRVAVTESPKKRTCARMDRREEFIFEETGGIAARVRKTANRHREGQEKSEK
jgi:hypothetical protein